MPYFCFDMRLLVVLVVGLYGLYAQCGRCGVSGSPILPQGFDPSYITLTVGRDTEVVIQFTLPDMAQQAGLTLYPNYAIYVDSLRMAGGDNYVVVQGTASTEVSYANGAFAFDQDPRYKQVRSGAPPAQVVVYRNPSPSEAGVPSGQPSPPRGCVRACIKGRQPTPAGTGDSLYILLRAFVDPNSVSLLPPSSSDISDKDTTNLMPTKDVFGNSIDLYSDTSLYYGPVYVVSQGTAIESALQGGIVLSPNPTWGVAMVRFTTTYSVPVRVRALDASGRVVHERDMGVLSPGEHTADLQLPAGIYIVELLAGKESYKARLVVLE
jgi:hypothetical protein